MAITLEGDSQEPQDPQRAPGSFPTPPLPTRRPAPIAPPQEPIADEEPDDDPNGYGAMIDKVLDRRQQQADEMLLTSFEAAKNANPALAREAQQLGQQVGVPADVAERNIDVIRHMEQRRRIEDERFAAVNPIFARKLRDPVFARVAKDDWDNLSAYERGVETAALNIERGRIGLRLQMNAFAGSPDSPDDFRRIGEIDARLGRIQPPEGVIARTAETLRYIRDPLLAGVAAASVTAAVSTVFPPAEVLTVPTAFTIGALTVGIPMAAAVEGGNLYIDMLRRPGVNPSDAWFASVGVGAVNSALETAGAGFIAAPIKKVIGKAVAETVSEALVRPTITKAAGKAALTYAKTLAGEGTTELLQEVSQIVAEGSLTGEWEGVGKRLGEVAIGTAEGLALIALPGPAMQFAHDRRRVAESKQNAQAFERMQEAAVASKLRNEAPDTFEKFAQDAAAGTAAETVYIDAAKFDEVLRQGGKEEGGKPLFDDLEKVAPGLADGVRAEAARGGDIGMPSSLFLTKLSGTEVGKALTPHVRFDIDDLSPFEAEQVEALAKEQETAVTEQAEKIDTTNEQVRAIEEGLAEQLVTTGRMGKAEANTNAKLWGAFVRTQSERLGMEPAEFQKAYSLRAQRGEVEDASDALLQGGRTDTPEFKAWFGESKVVDEKGAPLVAYHGTPEQFEVFESRESKRTGFLGSERAVQAPTFFFSGSPFVARAFGENRAEDKTGFRDSRLMKVYLSIQNPLDLTVKDAKRIMQRLGLTDRFGETLDKASAWEMFDDPAMVAKIKAAGYDGALISERSAAKVFGERKDPAAQKTFVAFEPTQIKSVNNRGTFDPSDPNILRKDDSGAIRGAFTFRNRAGEVAPLVLLTPDSDASTFIHESAHAFLSIYADLASQKASPVILDDFNTFLKWAGVESVEAWQGMTLEQQRPHQERFADGFESYMLKGEAPAPGLRGLFDKLAAFMREVWRTLKAENLSPEIRAVMDRMLASEEAVRTTQAVRGAVPAFQTAEEAGMSPEQWTAHQERQQSADADAVSKLSQATLRVMRWLSGAKGKALRALQAEEKGKRDALRGEVGAAVQAQPVYRAARWLRTGEMVNDDGTHTQGDKDQNHKIRTEDVAALGLELPGMTRADGMPADMVASAFGFESGEQMVRALANAAPIEGAIESSIDARMVAEHSDLADPAQREAAVDATLHTEARRRFVAAELRALTKSMEPERVTLAAAKEAARIALESKRISELTPRTFTVAARRASKEAQAAVAKGETAAAIAWKRRQLVQEAMADLATEARAKVAQAVKLFRKFNAPDKEIAQTRDIDLAYSAQALAAAYKLGPPIVGAQRKGLVAGGLAAVGQEHPTEAARLAPLLEAAAKNGAPLDYRNLTVEQFREVAETGEQLWGVARDEARLDAEGKAIDRQKALGDLAGQLGSLPPRSPSTRVDQGESPSPWRRGMMHGWDVLAGFKVMEHVARFLDGGKDGPFQRYVTAPMMRLLARYRAAKAPIVKRLAESIRGAQERAGSLWYSRITVPWLRAGGASFTFNGKREILGAMLHAGSRSNLEANLVGRGWGEIDPETGQLDTSRWDAAVKWLYANGILTEADNRFLETWWGTFAELLPQAQKAHKQRFGYEFETIELREVQTPFGALKGGYVPKRADRLAADPRFLQRYQGDDTATARAADFQYSVGATKGFTLGRDDNYRPPLNMDVGSLVSNVDEELRFIHLENGVNDVMKLLRGRIEGGPRLQDALNAYDRTLLNGVILPWLENTALQRTSLPGQWRALDTAFRFLRSAASVAFLGLNVANAMLQAGGVSNAALFVKGKHLRSAARTFFFSPQQSYRTMVDRSPFMQQRLDMQTRALQEEIGRASQGRYTATTAGIRQFMARWAFLPQRMFQTFADTVTWQGGYAQAIAEGTSEEVAIERADQAVRLAQGSGSAESLARYAVSTPFVQMWTQFGNYSNLVLNQLMGSQSRGHAFAFAVLLPALLETAVKSLFRGVEDEDDDDSTIDDLAARGAETVARNVTGMIPVVGPLVQQMAFSEGVRVLEAPGGALVREAYRGILEAGEALSEGEATAAEARAIATMVTLVTGLPVAAPVRLAQQATRER